MQVEQTCDEKVYIQKFWLPTYFQSSKVKMTEKYVQTAEISKEQND